ncbi:MAG: excisionase family DNA binding protein [Bacteroidia bacterium]|jgi:excisionase family DNA binding protein
MSSNIQVQRICEHCGDEFTAKTTVTRFCGDTCSKRAYKARLRARKIESSNQDTKSIKTRPIESLKAKEFLSVRDVATLLGCSLRTTYRLIDNGTIEAVNLSERMTRVKRSELDMVLQQSKPIEIIVNEVRYEISECYNLKEIKSKYGVSESMIQQLVKRHDMPKLRQGRYAYVPKALIDEVLSKRI